MKKVTKVKRCPNTLEKKVLILNFDRKTKSCLVNDKTSRGLSASGAETFSKKRGENPHKNVKKRRKKSSNIGKSDKKKNTWIKVTNVGGNLFYILT